MHSVKPRKHSQRGLDELYVGNGFFAEYFFYCEYKVDLSLVVQVDDE
jgi:hypothetical protein